MLTPRLRLVASMCKNAKILADIGTDHAYIPIFLVKNSLISSAIACDVKVGPVEIATNNVKRHKFEDKIDVRLANGLGGLCVGEVDTIVIAGMGGILISEIIKNNIDIAKSCQRLVLQPMTDFYILRKFLLGNGFKIIDEQLTNEGRRIYNVMLIEKGDMKFEKEIYYYINSCLKASPLFTKWILQKKNDFNKALSGLQKASVINNDEIKKYENLILELESL